MDTKILWKEGRLETVLSYGLVAAILVAAVVILGREVAHHINGFETWIAGLGPWALVVAVVLYSLLSTVFVPDTLLGMVASS